MSFPLNPNDDADKTKDYVTPARDQTAALKIEPQAVGCERTLGPYNLRKEIGRGAMGTVYEAEHSKLRRPVAIKVLPAEFTALPERLSRFRREMEAIGRLDHTNIVRAFDAGEFDGTHFLAMELIRGHDVDQLIKWSGPIDTGSACEIARQAALGLQHIYDNRLVHRDIKPSNLLVANNGTVKILDLGIARLRRDETTASSQTSMGSMIGTPDYVAPEQIESSGEVDIRADVYSLGCTLYTLLAGRTPFHGEQYSTQMSKLIAHTKQYPPDLKSVAPGTPTELAKIVHRMIAKKPGERFQTPQDVADSLLEWSDSEALVRLCQAAERGTIPVGEHNNSGAPSRLIKGSTKPKKAQLLKVAFPLVIVSLLFAYVFLKPFARPTIDDRANYTLPTSVNVNEETMESDPTAEPLTSIADFSQSIAENSQQVVESTRNIDQNTERIAETLDGLRDAFRMATRSGDIVSDPQSIGELYHNARAYQRQGNFVAARQMYLLIFERNGDFVDVHNQFLKLLKSRLDNDSILDVYDSMPGDHESVVRRFARIQVNEDIVSRARALQELIDLHPDFAPAAFELSRLSSLDVLGNQSLADKRDEYDWLRKFEQLTNGNQLSRYFLDSAYSEEMEADANRRWAAVRSINQALFESPVAVSYMSSRGFASVSVSVAEPTLEIQYRLSEADAFESTGHLPAVDRTTGKPVPKSLIMLPPGTEPDGIDIKYLDIRGTQQGPFHLELGQNALDQDSRNKLDLMATFWIKFVNRRGEQYVDFQNIATNRNVVAEVRYGLNVDKPDETMTLSDPYQNGIKNRVYIEDEVEFAVIQLRYTDGTESPIRRFDRIANQR